MSDVLVSVVSDIRKDGFQLDVFVEALIDQDQLELHLPSEFLVQLSRLELPLQVITDEE